MERLDNSVARGINGKYPDVFDLRDSAHHPMLVEAQKVPIENLRTETGSDPSDLLKRMQDQRCSGFEFWDVTGVFELIVPHGQEDFTCWEVEKTESGYKLNLCN